MGRSEFLKKYRIYEIWWDNYNQTNNVETIEKNGDYYDIVLKTGEVFALNLERVTVRGEPKRHGAYLNFNSNNTKHNNALTVPEQEQRYERIRWHRIAIGHRNKADLPDLWRYYIAFCQNEIVQSRKKPKQEDPNKQPLDTLLKNLMWHSRIRIHPHAVVHQYIEGKKTQNQALVEDELIYPFGCNQSQKKAVETALGESISVIQGPPGTGKTQTILNIIANLVVKGKTVAVVSNNNSATKNVWEKLNKREFDLGWMVAQLGNRDNQAKWFAEIPNRRVKRCVELTKEEIYERYKLNVLADEYYEKEIQLRRNEHDLREFTRQLHCYLEEEKAKIGQLMDSPWYERIKTQADGSLPYLSQLQTLIEELAEHPRGFRHLFTQLKLYFKKVRNLKAFEQDLDEKLGIVTLLKAQQKCESLSEEVEQQKAWLKENKHSVDRFIELSKRALMQGIQDHYKRVPIKDYNPKTYRNDPDFLHSFPIVTSSTYTLTSCANHTALFDYLIVDEASQVNLPTALLCMCYARNLVVVGDDLQLPVIISKDALPAPEEVPLRLDASERSLLRSFDFRDSPYRETILKEHYRCHPDIIEFCNRRFYNNQLVCMTKAPEDHVAFQWIESAIGAQRYDNGSRYNEKQIADTQDAIERLSNQGVALANIGIIAPYRKHANMFTGGFVDADTVHRYQGRERDHIIFNTVADRLDEFVDDPHLINVAVSRAKDSFTLVAPQYEGDADSNIMSLIRYIEQLDPAHTQIRDSKYRSVFEALFKNVQIETKDETESPAEALFRDSLTQVLTDEKFKTWRFIQEYPLRLLPRSMNDFTDDQVRFMLNGSRLDFMIYDSMDNQPIAVIEVDGASFHKKNTKQAKRDSLKNAILKQLDIPLMRLRTDSVKGAEVELIQQLLEEQYALRNKQSEAY